MRALGVRNPTAREAMQRPILAGATVGGLASQGYARGAPVGMAPEGLFAPDPQLPAQVARTSRAELMPELRLLIAVLDSAKEDLVKFAPGCVSDSSHHAVKERARLRYRLAREWVESDVEEHVTAFVPLCQALGLDVDATRTRLLTGTVGPAKPQRRHTGEHGRRVVGA